MEVCCLTQLVEYKIQCQKNNNILEKIGNFTVIKMCKTNWEICASVTALACLHRFLLIPQSVKANSAPWSVLFTNSI